MMPPVPGLQRQSFLQADQGQRGEVTQFLPCELIAVLRIWPADSPTELTQPASPIPK
jgi:hypothetical protein